MNVVSIILQSLLVLMFLMAGLGKISGSKMHVESFKHLRLPQWFRIVTGLIQLISVAALIIGYWELSWAVAGALLLGITAIGGILAHVRAKDSFTQTVMILFLGILAFIIVFVHWSELANFPGFGS